MAAAQPKRKSSPWMLIVGLLVAVLVGWGLYEVFDSRHDGELPPAVAREVADSPRTDDAAAAAAPVAITVVPMPPPPTATDNTPIPVDVIVLTPAPHLGQAVVGTAKVAEVPFDRGFWLENNGQRMFAVIAKSPDMEQAVNINPGQTVRLAGVVYDRALASGIAGEMDPQAMETIADQPAFLLVDARNIAVLEPAPQ